MKEKILKRIKRLKGQVKKYDIKNPHTKFNYFGGFDYGYIMGKINILEEQLEELEEEVQK